LDATLHYIYLTAFLSGGVLLYNSNRFCSS